jgi:hypothetical protein
VPITSRLGWLPPWITSAVFAGRYGKRGANVKPGSYGRNERKKEIGIFAFDRLPVA